LKSRKKLRVRKFRRDTALKGGKSSNEKAKEGEEKVNEEGLGSLLGGSEEIDFGGLRKGGEK